jgi:hypothetical protein
VTSLEDMSKLKALRRARERLETALATDAGWQALQRSSATAGAGGGETAGLQAELMRSNPLYRAWTNVNAAIEARQDNGAKDVAGATAPPPSPSASDLDAGRLGRQGIDAMGVGPRELGLRPPPEEEASVSFVARSSPLGPSDGPPVQRVQAVRAHASLPVTQGHEPAGRQGTPAVEGWQGQEAEVSVVSVDARRHAGAVDRLLRALRGEINPG